MRIPWAVTLRIISPSEAALPPACCISRMVISASVHTSCISVTTFLPHQQGLLDLAKIHLHLAPLQSTHHRILLPHHKYHDKRQHKKLHRYSHTNRSLPAVAD